MIQPTDARPQMNWAIVNYKIINQLPIPEHSSHLYEYLFASNGAFMRAKRRDLEVLIPIQMYELPIKGLAPLEPYIKLTPDKVPERLVTEMWTASRLATPNEILFHLQPNQDSWQLTIPEQVQTPSSCQPLSNDSSTSFPDALIEVHSHHDMSAFFSSTDDNDESGFRIYSVIGRVNSSLEIRTRIGLYQHYWNIPSSLIYELPSWIVDRALRTAGGNRHQD